jgi:uncharacterized membrane protein
MDDYFVTVGGITVDRHLTREKAITVGKKNWSASGSNVGIGKYKIVKGKKVYILLPLNNFI